MENINLNKKMIKREKLMMDISLGTMIVVLIASIIWLIVLLVRGA
jgi:cell division protein FtsB